MKTLTVPALVCAILALATVDAGCPSGWSSIGSRCFKYVPKKLSWSAAEQNCVTMGAHLASVHSPGENLSIQKLVLNAMHWYREKTWLGGSDSHKGTWLWTDGTPFNYRNCGQFNNNLRRQRCLQMNSGGNMCWDDVECWVKRPSLCAKKP